jgi:hypothetical protein
MCAGGYDMSMRNRLKIVAIVALVVVGMVLYKERFDRKEDEKEDDKKNEEVSEGGQIPLELSVW